MFDGASLLASRLPSTPLDLAWGSGPGELAVPRVELTAAGIASGRPLPGPFLAAGYLFEPGPQPPLDLSFSLHQLIHDIASRCPELGHVRAGQVHVGLTLARNSRRHGLQARITPMRFPGGEVVRRRHGRLYRLQRYYLAGTELLYLISFCLPRFLNQSFDEKLITIFHELFHIAPQFNGDLRRHAGRCRIHTRSQKQLDQHMAGLAREYLQTDPDPQQLACLRLDFAELMTRHGRIIGEALPMPKLVAIG